MTRLKPRHIAEAAKPQGRVIVVALLICALWIAVAIHR